LRSFANLDFVKGFARSSILVPVRDIQIIECWVLISTMSDANGDDGDELALEVYCTQSAIERSKIPTPPASKRSRLSQTSKSFTHSSYHPAQSSDMKLPCGHWAYYRTIERSTPCNAFRARVDHENQGGKERAVLITAGERAVYIIDLEYEERMETIPIEPEEYFLVQVNEM